MSEYSNSAPLESGMISPEQCRAARAWLGWSQQDIAKLAVVGLSTVRDFENGIRTPMLQNRLAIQSALEKAGVLFLFNGKTGLGITVVPSMPPRPVADMIVG